MVQAMAQDAESPREFILPVQVYIEDTDAGGIVYYVNYLKFMERARSEWMRARGYNHIQLAAENTQFVVAKCEVNYLKPAIMDDVLQVTVRAAVKGARIEFEQQIWRGEEQLCHAQITVACVRADNLKPQGLPPQLKTALVKE